jgi:hypothetical protein
LNEWSNQIYFGRYGISPDTRKVLENMWHNVALAPSFIASASRIMIDNKGVRLGRSAGEAIGYWFKI